MIYNRISADCHVDLPWLPPDLFTSNASAALKDRMPYVVDGPEGPSWTTKSGVGAPAAPVPNGTYGRFRYVSAYNVFVLVNDINDNVRFYKHTPGCP